MTSGDTLLPAAGGGDSARIGPYRLLGTLGEGGMGTVYLAEQTVPVKRRVALKLIKLGMDSKAVVARFEQERQALAVMQHDGIAKVFDCGMSDRGQPFFVMELVKGQSLTEYCDRCRLSVPQRIVLMQQVCDAVQHAHQKGVVHRDLKPGNVLVADDEGKPRVKIIDFGLAKAMGPNVADTTLFTEVGQILGTPEYMAPEQADPRNQDIDTRADVYSLGVMLYQVLTGELPFSAQELRSAGLLGMQRMLTQEEPARPSQRLTSLGDKANEVAERRRTNVATLKKALHSDLDWLVLKAIDKDRTRRYETANALKTDLQRYLDHEPLLAGPPSAAYRVKKLLRRYRSQVIAASLVLTVLLAGGVGTFVQYRRAEAEAAANAELAQQKGELARAEAAAKEQFAAKVREFDQLAGVVLHQRAVAAAATLYPAWPQRIQAMETWLADVAPLLAMRPELETTVAALRARTTTDEAQRFLRDTLASLLENLDSLATKEKPGVEQRLAWAKQITELSLHHPKAKVTWHAVREAIAANPRCADRRVDLRDDDVVGLVPLGENPVTHLHEFYELRSAWDGTADPRSLEIPVHQADGSIAMDEGTGIVFVLLPGGTMDLGAQKEDKTAPLFDPAATPAEALHEVTLEPFFLARHELTQSQWARLWTWDESLRTPSNFKPGDTVGKQQCTPWNPVEQVDRTMCETLLMRHGMVLPTDAQWEYGCRGGTTTMWIVDKGKLGEVANLADADAKRVIPAWQCETWHDGHVNHSPVGSYAANAFGLFDMHGNVWEWTRDLYGPYGDERDGDGLRSRGNPAFSTLRGGSHALNAAAARSSIRSNQSPTARGNAIGVRAARSLRPRD